MRILRSLGNSLLLTGRILWLVVILLFTLAVLAVVLFLLYAGWQLFLIMALMVVVALALFFAVVGLTELWFRVKESRSYIITAGIILGILGGVRLFDYLCRLRCGCD